MATFKTDVAAGQQSLSTRDRVQGKKVTGQPCIVDALYTVATPSIEQANDLVDIAELPVGAQLIPDLCRVSTDGVGGTTSTIATLGDALDDDRYSASAIAIVSAASSTVTPTNAIMSSPWTITDATKVIKAKLGLASGNYTAGKIIRFRLAFIMP